MACLKASASERGRRLFEMLQEQQEPFLLDVYLLEHPCSRKMLKSQATTMSCPGNASQRLQRLSGLGFRRRGGFLRCMLAKIVHGKAIRKALSWDKEAPESGRLSVFDCFSEKGSKTDDAEPSRFSCVTRIGVGESDDEHQPKHMKMEEELEQHSPVSVLELRSYESSPFHNHKKDENPSISSHYSLTAAINIFEKLLEAAWMAPGFPPPAMSKRELDQPKQLPLECAKETGENTQDSHECLSPEVTEKGIHESVLSWERQNGDLDSIRHLVASEVSNTGRQWSHFEPQMREIGIEIAAAIYEEIMKETVLDLLDLHCTSNRC